MIHPRELEHHLVEWVAFVGGAIVLFRYIALELIEAIGACVCKLIEFCKMVRAKR